MTGNRAAWVRRAMSRLFGRTSQQPEHNYGDPYGGNAGDPVPWCFTHRRWEYRQTGEPFPRQRTDA